ncbi:hypothetical protein R50073_18940 [Maricurvus nonylphenolicus]|uniref:AraC family transcriptional regulator n=1 Tax=Maricurvus nonylphenolicus TaxID=1008307 RepID=UPI0036F25B71
MDLHYIILPELKLILEHYGHSSAKLNLDKNTDLDEVIKENLEDRALFFWAMERFVKQMKRPDWGLIVADNVSMAKLGAFGYAGISAPSLMHTMKLMLQFPPLSAWFYDFNFVEGEEFVEVHFTPNRPLGELEKGIADMTIAQMCRHIFNLYPLHKSRIEVSYCGAEREYVNEIKRRIPGPITFESSTYSLKIPAELYYSESPFYVKEIWDVALQNCKKMLSVIKYMSTTDPVDAVREYLDEAIADNYRKRPSCDQLPNISAIAEKLNLSEASLRHYLRSKNHQFRQLKEEARRKWLLKLLREEELTIQTVGYILGYHDAANFTRSCMSWFDMTPKQLRNQLPPEEESTET